MVGFIRYCVIALAAVFSVARGQTATLIDTTLVMNDGIALDALYGRPTTAPPAAGYPAVLFIHGFNGSKDDMRSYAQYFADNGYATAAYTVRGQGQSQGTFDMFTSPRIMDDLRAGIAFLGSLPNVNASKIGVAGASQGGIHSWSAAAYGMPVACVVSVVANGRFDEDWCQDNAINWIFGNSIIFSNVRFGRVVTDTIRPAIVKGNTALLSSYLARGATAAREKSVTTPTLIMVSYYDQFFNPTSAVRQFGNIAGPKRLVMYPGTHASPAIPSIRANFERLYQAWLDYWLKGSTPETGIADPDSAVVLYDGATIQPRAFALGDSALWGDGATSTPQFAMERWFLDPVKGLSKTLELDAFRTTNFIQGSGSEALVFRSPPMTDDYIVIGAKSRARLVMNGSGNPYQASLMVFDVNPADNSARPLTRGHYQVAVNADGRETMDFPLNACMHTVPKGHCIEVHVHGGLGFVPNSGEDFGNAVMGPLANSTDSLFTGGTDPARSSCIELGTYHPDVVAADRVAVAPRDIAIGPNHPNPFGVFDARTIIPVTAASRNARLTVFNTLGRRVFETHPGAIPAGASSVVFDAAGLPAGIYHAVLRDGAATVTRSVQYLGSHLQ